MWKHAADRRRHQSITHQTHHSIGSIFSASHSDRFGATQRLEMWEENIILQAIVFQFFIISKTINELHGYLLHMCILIQNQSQINASTRFCEDTCVILMARVCESQDKKEKCILVFFNQIIVDFSHDSKLNTYIWQRNIKSHSISNSISITS